MTLPDTVHVTGATTVPSPVPTPVPIALSSAIAAATAASGQATASAAAASSSATSASTSATQATTAATTATTASTSASANAAAAAGSAASASTSATSAATSAVAAADSATSASTSATNAATSATAAADSATSASMSATNAATSSSSAAASATAAATFNPALFAPLASPLLTGTPVAPTAAQGTNTTQLATTAFVIAEILARATGGVPRGWLTGLTLSYASATTVGIAVGTCANEDAGAAQTLTLAAAMTKGLGAWAAGSGNGGLDTGTIAASTWYHAHLIRKDADGTIDALLSLSATAPTIPSGWTARRRLGSIRTNPSSQITPFVQRGDRFVWNSPVIDYAGTSAVNTAVTRSLTVPTGLSVTALLSASISATATNYDLLYVSALTQDDNAVPAYAGPLAGANVTVGATGSGMVMTQLQVDTNASAQIRTRTNATGNYIHLFTHGWIDSRGK